MLSHLWDNVSSLRLWPPFRVSPSARWGARFASRDPKITSHGVSPTIFQGLFPYRVLPSAREPRLRWPTIPTVATGCVLRVFRPLDALLPLASARPVSSWFRAWGSSFEALLHAWCGAEHLLGPDPRGFVPRHVCHPPKRALRFPLQGFAHHPQALQGPVIRRRFPTALPPWNFPLRGFLPAGPRVDTPGPPLTLGISRRVLARNAASQGSESTAAQSVSLEIDRPP